MRLRRVSAKPHQISSSGTTLIAKEVGTIHDKRRQSARFKKHARQVDEIGCGNNLVNRTLSYHQGGGDSLFRLPSGQSVRKSRDKLITIWAHPLGRIRSRACLTNGAFAYQRLRTKRRNGKAGFRSM